MEMKCSLMSKKPRACQCPARSSDGLMSTRKYKYTIPPSSAEITYKMTTALANEAGGTVRKRLKNEPDRPRAGAHVASVWWVIAPSSPTATRPWMISRAVAMSALLLLLRGRLLEQLDGSERLGRPRPIAIE